MMGNSTKLFLISKTAKAKYPDVRVIVLDDNFNSFQYVANCLLNVIPGMSEKRSWDFAVKVDNIGSA